MIKLEKLKSLRAFSLSLAVLLPALTIALGACENEMEEGAEEQKSTDQRLYEMSIPTQGFTWYKKSDALLPRSSSSGHSQPYLRTRFNSAASASLDTEGKIKTGTTFPEGSLIVKELILDNEEITRYAILYKSSAHADADDNGWVWGYVNADGSVASPASNKGGACISCHSQSGNIDQVLMGKYFP